jgi:hypothetical protein
MLFQFGLKKTFEVNKSKGTSEITPKRKRFRRYFLRFLVLKNPSTKKNIKRGKAILPRIEIRFDT